MDLQVVNFGEIEEWASRVPWVSWECPRVHEGVERVSTEEAWSKQRHSSHLPAFISTYHCVSFKKKEAIFQKWELGIFSSRQRHPCYFLQPSTSWIIIVLIIEDELSLSWSPSFQAHQTIIFIFGKVLTSSEISLPPPLNQTEVGGNRSIGISDWCQPQEKLFDSNTWFLSS